MVALVGPNGSGKTTLIRTLAGTIKPAAGIVSLDSADLNILSRATIAQRCAYLPQHTLTDFQIRVEDVVALGRYPHLGAWTAMRKADYEAVAWAIDRVGLTALRGRTLPTLSGGERQRVFIARALAQEAPILLLDEPISGLDIGRQLELMTLLADLNAGGRSILASLHDLRPALEFFPQAILLDHGRIEDSGTTEQVIFGRALSTAFRVNVGRSQQVSFRVSS